MKTSEAPYSRRFRLIIYIFGIWAAVITVRLFYFSIVNRDKAFDAMESESLEKRRIPAFRGSLYSASGVMLVKSIREADLCLNSQLEAHQLSGLLEILKKELGLSRALVMNKISVAPNLKAVVLKKNISQQEIERFARYFMRDKYLFVKMRERRENQKEAYRRYGRRLESRLRLFEKKYAERLSGSDLIYEAMLDKHGKILPKTYREIQAFKKGQDVYLTKEEWP